MLVVDEVLVVVGRGLGPDTLLELAGKHGETLSFTKREISEIAATTVETTIRVMSGFQKKGWISSTRGKIRIEALDKLQAVIR